MYCLDNESVMINVCGVGCVTHGTLSGGTLPPTSAHHFHPPNTTLFVLNAKGFEPGTLPNVPNYPKFDTVLEILEFGKVLPSPSGGQIVTYTW